LMAYARDAGSAHHPAWRAFNKALSGSGEVGIWHETYVVPRSNVEAVYHHMPAIGLGSFAERIPASGRRRGARGRLSVAGAAASTAHSEAA
jgi:hypothetical protein